MMRWNRLLPSFLTCGTKKLHQHYLHSHDLPADVGRSLIRKLDRLDQMMQSMEAPYRKKRRYYGLLEEEISKDVR